MTASFTGYDKFMDYVPVINGRWVDGGPAGQSTIVIPYTTLPTDAEWYITSGASTVLNASGDWTGPVSAKNGSVLVFTVSKIVGATVQRYTSYTYSVGMRDTSAGHTPAIHTNTSSGAYPTNGWYVNGLNLNVRVTASHPNSSNPYTVDWNPVTGTDFSNKYVVQRALGTLAPPGWSPSYGTTSTPASVVIGPGETEESLTGEYGLKGFFSFHETSDTSVALEILPGPKENWTWFRVMAVSDLYGCTGAVPHDPVMLITIPWVGVPNDPALYTSSPASGAVVIGEPVAPSTDTVTPGYADDVKAKTLPMETNLPMLKSGIGGISHMLPRGDTDLVHKSVRWREGMLVLNGDQTVSAGHTSRRWGFRFHYNPSTWSQSSALAQNIDLTTYNQTGGSLLIPSTFSTVDLTVYLNRIVELSQGVPSDDPEKTRSSSPLPKRLTADDFYLGSGDGAPQASIAPTTLAVPYYNEANLGAVAPSYTSGETVDEKIDAVLRKGTLADIEYLYRACNGDPVYVSHTSGKTADVGMLNMTILDLYLGPNITYSVRVNSASIQHMMFNNRMIPIFSQVQLSMVRGLTMVDKGAVTTTDFYRQTMDTATNAAAKAKADAKTGSTS